MLSSLEHFAGLEVVVTEKMDGENTTLYSDGFHARSINSKGHESRDWLGAFHASIAGNIPEGWRVCGENLFAKHSLAYSNLESYFLGFSLWNDNNEALSWDETLEWFSLIGIVPVRTIWRGTFSEEKLLELAADLDLNVQEGFVVRVAGNFRFEEFATSVAKYVRKGHVQTDSHWKHQKIVPNCLASKQ